jgi:2-iminobutanoate/2-iminopropanoate deaminase
LAGFSRVAFVARQASVDATGDVVADSFEGEMRRSMQNLQDVLSACGLDLRDVVQVRAYVGRTQDLDAYNRIYREYFDPPFPARTTLAECIGSLKFEIDVVALDRPSRSSDAG